MTGKASERTAARLIIASLLLVAGTAGGLAQEDELALRQAGQRRAQRMARELVKTVLDGQIHQLEENGLAGEPIYDEIQALRKDITAIVDVSMRGVVEQLAAAERATGAERQQKYAAARAATREVVLQLDVARQTVMRRIRRAELVEQAGRMLKLQRHVQEETASLIEFPPERRADRAVGLLADQRDIASLFRQHIEALDEVSTWDGEIAANALAAKRWLADADIEKELANAEQALHRADYADAVARQRVLMERFEELWNRLDIARRDRRSGASDLLERARELLARQRTLRDAVDGGNPLSPPALSLIEDQQALATDLGSLAEPLAGDPTLSPLQRQAEAAAGAATRSLFIEDRAAGLTEQARVIDRLGALVELLASLKIDPHDRSAAELAQAIAQLERARTALADVAAASDSLEPDDAVRGEFAGRLQRAAAELPEAAAVAARIEAAAQAMRDNARAGAVLRQARAALEETLADWKRAEIAVRIGELARAAEALERAAAAERSIAQSTRPSSGDPPSDETRSTWPAIHHNVMEVARASMQGIRPAAPQAARRIEESLAAGGALGSMLADAAKEPSPNDAVIAERAASMGKSLSDAAATLREVIGQSARDLVELSDGQLPPVQTASQAVETAISAVASEDAHRLEETAASAAALAAQADFASTLAAQAAHRAAMEKNLADAAAGLDRAAIALAARRKELEEARSLSEQLGRLATRQQAAVDTIDASREELASAPPQAEKMSETQRRAAREMRSATQQFAATQQATGEAAARISGQRQLANAAIREALRAAGRLPMPIPPPAEPAPEATAQASAQEPRVPGESSSSPGEGEPSAEQPPGTKTASSGAPGQNQTGGSGTSDGSSGGKAIGTELVPAAAHETAQMMAGAQAQAAMSAMEASGAPSDEIAASESGAPLPEGALDGDGRPADSEAMASEGPVASTEGAPPAEGAAASSNTGQDAALPGAAGGDAGWFARLPADVREAIRASSSQPAPKGYEERLKRYFEAVEPE